MANGFLDLIEEDAIDKEEQDKIAKNKAALEKEGIVEYFIDDKGVKYTFDEWKKQVMTDKKYIEEELEDIWLSKAFVFYDTVRNKVVE